MAIAFDSSAEGAALADTSLTFSHTCTGSDLILWVGVDTGNASGGTDVVTGVTYNAVSMTRANTSVIGGGANRRCYLYYLINPATTANNVIVSANTTADIRATAMSYTGAKQSGVPDSQNTGTDASSTTITVSTTVVAFGSWVVSSHSNSTAEPTGGAGVTARQTASAHGGGDSNGHASPGSYSMTWNLGGTGDSAICMASFEADVPPAITNKDYFYFM